MCKEGCSDYNAFKVAVLEGREREPKEMINNGESAIRKEGVVVWPFLWELLCCS